MILSADIRVQQGGFYLEAQLVLNEPTVCVINGPTGSGKTTLLRTIAGLTKSPESSIVCAGQTWQSPVRSAAPEKRGIGYVFQEALLFEHLDVLGNISFAIEAQRSARKESENTARNRLEEAIEHLHLNHLLRRRCSSLSGGERARVAIARALLGARNLLLMDEPLAALDPQARQETMASIERLSRHLRVPLLYVSHSADETAALADQLLLLEGGRVQAFGPLNSVLTDQPTHRSLPGEAAAVLRGVLTHRDEQYGLSTLDVGGVSIVCPDDVRGREARRVRILARDVSIATQQPSGLSIQNVLPAIVERVIPTDTSLMLVRLGVGDQQILASVTRKALDDMQLTQGAHVFALIKSASLIRSH